MRRILLLWLAILLLHGYNASSQTTPGKQVCLSVPQATKIQDSLRVLPIVRQEAAAWQSASHHFQLAADSLGRASSLNLAAQRATQKAFDSQKVLTQSEAAKAESWKKRARRRSLVNIVLLALAGGVGYLAITH